MERLVEIVAVNAVSVTVLAVAAAVAGRFVKRPAVRHVLWLVVLLKLVTPPVLEIAVLPAPPAAGAVEETARALVALPAAAAPADTPGDSGAVDPAALLHAGLLTWLAGTVALGLLVAMRAFRFARGLSGAPPADEKLETRIAVMATKMGVSPVPPVQLVAGRLPPMLWSRRLLLPADLMSRLDPDERDALIAHELAHLRRRDHWVRYIELATAVAFWWHPVVWWARRNLRRAEEQACDALVVETLPGSPRAYAKGLLKTLEFLADRGRAIPGLATGAVRTPQIKERLTMILSPVLRGRMSTLQRWSLAAVAAGALLLFPTWAEIDVADEASPTDERLLAVEREIADLAGELERLHVRRMELQHVLESERLRRERQDVERKRDRLLQEGHEREAELLRLELEERERALAELRLEIERKHLRSEKELQARELSRELVRIKHEIEILTRDGRTDEARELEEALRELNEHRAR